MRCCSASRRVSGLLLAAVLLLGACTPSMTPLYRDYRAPALSDEAVRDSVHGALQAVGWTPVADGAALLRTEPVTLQQWGLYRVEVSAEVLPLAGGHVRVLLHPYRRYVTGHRSKMPYLPGGLRRTLVPELNRALEAHGLEVLDTPRRRDRRVVDR